MCLYSIVQFPHSFVDSYLYLYLYLSIWLRVQPQGPAVANAQEVTNATVVGGPETIQVQMPSGVQPGEMLCTEHHGAQYSIRGRYIK